jgi:hypothetical protein
MDSSVHSFSIHYSTYDSIFGSGYVHVVGSCEHGNEISGPIKGRAVLD